MNVLFIGGLYPKDRENELLNNSRINYQFAANNFQWSLISGLDHYFKTLKIITSPTIGNYPNYYKKLVFKESKFFHNSKSEIESICLGTINVPIISLLIKYFRVKSEIAKWVKTIKGDKYIIVYSPHTPYLKAALDLKDKFRNLRVCLIVPDLPEFMSDNHNLIYRRLKKLDKKILSDSYKKVNSFVLLSEHMKKPLSVSNRPWTLLEGIFDGKETKSQVTKYSEKVILYCGALTKKDGIFTLIKAFMSIPDNNYRLWIRGNGPIYHEVEDMITSDSRIKMIERMEKSKLFELQKKVTILINPTPASEKYTKFFFPSKMMEYLASGTPAITCRLEGIPEEYFQYCYVTDKDDELGLRNKIIEVCEKKQSELDEFGAKAAKFIIEKKNPIIQCAKIYNLLTTL